MTHPDIFGIHVSPHPDDLVLRLDLARSHAKVFAETFEASECARGVFYFSGHGFEELGKNQLLMQDDEGSLAQLFVRLTSLLPSAHLFNWLWFLQGLSWTSSSGR